MVDITALVKLWVNSSRSWAVPDLCEILDKSLDNLEAYLHLM